MSSLEEGRCSNKQVDISIVQGEAHSLTKNKSGCGASERPSRRRAGHGPSAELLSARSGSRSGALRCSALPLRDQQLGQQTWSPPVAQLFFRQSRPARRRSASASAATAGARPARSGGHDDELNSKEGWAREREQDETAEGCDSAFRGSAQAPPSTQKYVHRLRLPDATWHGPLVLHCRHLTLGAKAASRSMIAV